MIKHDVKLITSTRMYFVSVFRSDIDTFPRNIKGGFVINLVFVIISIPPFTLCLTSFVDCYPSKKPRDLHRIQYLIQIFFFIDYFSMVIQKIVHKYGVVTVFVVNTECVLR